MTTWVKVSLEIDNVAHVGDMDNVSIVLFPTKWTLEKMIYITQQMKCRFMLFQMPFTKDEILQTQIM